MDPVLGGSPDSWGRVPPTPPCHTDPSTSPLYLPPDGTLRSWNPVEPKQPQLTEPSDQ